MTRYATVEREHEVLVDLVALVAGAHPADRLLLARTLRADALYETVDLPSPRALVWLARRLEKTTGGAAGAFSSAGSGPSGRVRQLPTGGAARGNSRECVEPVARAVPVLSGSGA